MPMLAFTLWLLTLSPFQGFRYLLSYAPVSPTIASDMAMRGGISIRTAAMPSGAVLGQHIEAGDGRVQLLEKFLGKSPLAPYASLFVEEADRYNIDYRLVPAIAMCESNLGKRIPSKDSYNAWGIAVYTNAKSGATFKGWEEAIRWVYAFVNRKFIGRNISDLKGIGAIWAPPSIEKEHSWARCVESFMKQIL